jgi:hypothetical protein
LFITDAFMTPHIALLTSLRLYTLDSRFPGELFVRSSSES